MACFTHGTSVRGRPVRKSGCFTHGTSVRGRFVRKMRRFTHEPGGGGRDGVLLEFCYTSAQLVEVGS